MRGTLYRSVAMIAAFSLVTPTPLYAQPAPVAVPATAGAEATAFSPEQLDALLAPIALYPDELLTQTLMAATFPLQVVEAQRWLDANRGLSGDALTQALQAQNWDPSVKSLIPFPQVLAMLNSKLDWTQQLGYAFATQQADVMNAVQQLRQQAQAAGYLQTTAQQRVVVDNSAIVIEPADPELVYVPVYSPTVVYGTWGYPAYPPVYIPPPPGYVVGDAFLTGLAFATGVAIVGSLWGWARPSWGGRNVSINVNNYNHINYGRPPIREGIWHAPAGGVGGRPFHPPIGPVGAPGRPIGGPGVPGRPSGGPGVPGRPTGGPGVPGRPTGGPAVPGRPTGGPAVPGRPTGGPAVPGRPTGGPAVPGRPTGGPAVPGRPTGGPAPVARPAPSRPAPVARPAPGRPAPVARPAPSRPAPAPHPAPSKPGKPEK